MGDSDSENEHFCFFGKPLDPYDEESMPKRRPITVEEQIATDAQGRRRFHGAFTGGFSAGFFNTVGTLEGWLPNEFKSSRSEKSKGVVQKPEDFMDDEDLGEDGFAPQVVRATSDYDTSRKRKKQVFSDGPIPGEPVLHNILSSGNETIGYMLLKNLRLKDKKKQKEEMPIERTYGCQMPKTEEFLEYTEENQYKIPEIYKEFLAKPKTNTFGLGYSGLDKSHFSLFPMENKSKLVVTDKNNKKLSISGQAFGVGAFEEPDDDIYMKEDLSRYDFELTSEKEKTKLKQGNEILIFDLFVKSQKTPVLKNKVKYPPPTIPHSFTGKHKVKKSRFEPIAQEEDTEHANKSGSKINPMIRAKYLGEDTEGEHTTSNFLKKEEPKLEEPQQSSSTADINSYLTDRFVSSSKNEDVNDILEVVEKVETIHGTEQMREAVRMKMFGPLTRITSDWIPNALLCKRFNVPEPFVDRPEKSRTRTKNIIFEYQKHIDEETTLQPGLKKEEVETASIPEPFNVEGNKDVPLNETVNQESIEIKEEPLEKNNEPKDITEKIDIEENQDLFKAIFMSSDSESDEEKEVKTEEKSSEVTNKEEERKEEMKSMVLSDQLLPKIKPIKEGVLSGISFHKFVKPGSGDKDKDKEASVEEDTNDNLKKEDTFHCYGPKIPEKLPNQLDTSRNVISSESEDEWVEKDEDRKKKKKHKKEKKHKKDKRHKREKKKKYKD